MAEVFPTHTDAHFPFPGRECWCDDILDMTSFKSILDECQMPCAGDLTSVCGSPNRMDLYKLNSPPAVDAPYYSMGCWVDKGAVHRALPELYADDNMSWDMCAGFAARRGFKHFGVEYGMLSNPLLAPVIGSRQGANDLLHGETDRLTVVRP